MTYSNYHSRRTPGFLRYIADLLRFRHLCWNLVGSDLRARFRRSRLGILWAVIQPLAFSLLIAWAWGVIFKSQSYWDYAVYVFSGMLVWEYVSNTFVGAMESLTGSVGYLRQARIPFFVFQARVPLTGVVVFCAGQLGLFGMVGALQLFPAPGIHLLYLAAYPVVLVAVLTPAAIILSILGAKFRDLKHIVQIGLQAVFFVSPVMLDRSVFLDERLTILQYLNPMVPLLDMLRGPLFDGRVWSTESMVTIAIWGGALWIFAFTYAVRSGRRLVFAL